MQLKISTNDLTEIILEQNFPENYYDVSSALTERVTHIDGVPGKGSYREIFFRGIHIAYGNLTLRQTTELLFESDYETVEMHFDLCGESHTNITGATGYDYKFSTNRHNVIYVPGIKGSIKFPSDRTQVLEINLRPDIFMNYLDDAGTFNDFIKLIRNQSPALLSKHHLPITPAMQRIIGAIIGCTRSGIYKRLFLEAKVIELLLLQLEQFSACGSSVLQSIKPADIDKMHHAKEIILRRLNNPYSLVELAKQIGTNEFTLKKGFKEVFGTTVFGMISEVRLEQAQRLLLSGENTVAEISELTGYKYQSNFTKAFKKKFGVAPKTHHITEYL